MDIGVHQDGLVHVSQLADRFVKDPAEVVKVHQRVMVTVIEVDLPRKRIALSMRTNPEAGRAKETRTAPAGPRPPRPAAPPRPAPPGRAHPPAARPPSPGSGGFNTAFADAFRKKH